ncbi:MAG: alpha/beta hydrolase [Candidatus Helarchaeota archaeon]
MISKKNQYLFLILFFSFTLTGIFGLNFYPTDVIRSTHQAYSDQTISFNLYQPRELTQPAPVVVMGHGIIVNKEMMTNFAIELAHAGYIVASLDWSGHGQSTGMLSNLTADLEAVINEIPSIQPLANMSALALLGYSMGGFGTYPYAATHLNVKAWVGVGTLADGAISNTTNPHNVLMIVGSLDEAFSPDETKIPMVNLTGASSINDVQLEYLYGNIANGTARKVHVVPGVDHLTTPWNEEFVMTATNWIILSFGDSLSTIQPAFPLREFFVWIGFIGLICLIFTLAAILADKMGLKKRISTFDQTNLEPNIISKKSFLSFISRYYLITFLLLPTIVIFIPTFFFIPLPLTTALSALVGCLGINLLIFCWRLAKKWERSIIVILKENLMQNWVIWLYSAVLTIIFFFIYYLTIGLNYLGMIPSIQRIPSFLLIGVLSFFVFWVYSIFIQKFSTPYLETKIKGHPITKYLTISLINFLLIDSWFVALILIPCILMNNYFFAMILILMVPIFLFLTYFGVYMEKLTGSTIPNAIFHAVILSFIIVTLSPYISFISFFGRFF